jgi:hypothetical protein
LQTRGYPWRYLDPGTIPSRSERQICHQFDLYPYLGRRGRHCSTRSQPILPPRRSAIHTPNFDEYQIIQALSMTSDFIGRDPLRKPTCGLDCSQALHSIVDWSVDRVVTNTC